MTRQQKEVNKLYHLAGMTTSQVAGKLEISQDEVINLLVTWNEFYKRVTVR